MAKVAEPLRRHGEGSLSASLNGQDCSTKLEFHCLKGFENVGRRGGKEKKSYYPSPVASACWLPRHPLPSGEGFSLKLAQLDALHRMVLGFFENQVRAFARGQDVAPKVYGVNGFPDLNCGFGSLIPGQIRIAMKVRFLALKHRTLKRQKPVHIPLADVGLVGIDEDGEIKVVRYECERGCALSSMSGLQNIQSFNDDDVRLPDHLCLVRHDVVGFMGVDRNLHFGLPGFQVRQELKQPSQVVTFGKSLSAHQAPGFEHAVWKEKPV